MLLIGRESSYTDLVRDFIDHFCPDGYSNDMKANIDNLEYFVGKCGGGKDKKPPHAVNMPDGEEEPGWTFVEWRRANPSTPVRLYLFLRVRTNNVNVQMFI